MCCMVCTCACACACTCAYAICCVLYSMLCTIFCVLYAVCCVLRAACCVLYAVCCMLCNYACAACTRACTCVVCVCVCVYCVHVMCAIASKPYLLNNSAPWTTPSTSTIDLCMFYHSKVLGGKTCTGQFLMYLVWSMEHNCSRNKVLKPQEPP